MKNYTDTDKLIGSVKKIHMIGIGGSGMCPIAEILHTLGYSLTGSDNNQTETLSRVQAMGVPVTVGHFAENVHGAELVVYSAAIMQDNPELVEARRLGIPTVERSLMLGYLTRRYDNVIGVCGTHGKTTTSSMITQILLEAKCDPSAVIGGKLPAIDGYGRCGQSDTMVCESCEYVDTFLQLSPDIAVLLNVDNDHMEYFKTMDNLVASFHKFLSFAGKAVIVNGDDERALTAARGVTAKVITFGRGSHNDYYAKNITMEHGAFAHFDVMHGGRLLLTATLSVPGEHNVYNAMAAITAALTVGVAPQDIADSLPHFGGAGRRFEILGRRGGITVADDYAHHPRELRVTLETAKKMDFNRVIAVFQPFTYSRTAMLMDDFAEVLSIADRVVLSEIMGSREKNTYGVYSSQLADKIDGSVWFNTFDEIADYIAANAEEGDLVITLGCGDIYKAAKLILQKYDNK